MRRPDPSNGGQSGLLGVLPFVTSLVRDPRRLRSALGKLATVWRTGGLAGVWHRLRQKFHWGSVRYSTWVKVFDTRCIADGGGRLCPRRPDDAPPRASPSPGTASASAPRRIWRRAHGPRDCT